MANLLVEQRPPSPRMSTPQLSAYVAPSRSRRMIRLTSAWSFHDESHRNLVGRNVRFDPE
jgi:hypothetical protein